MKVALVLGASTGGIGQHIRSLVERLPRYGIEVDVHGPTDIDAMFGFSAQGVGFYPVDIGVSPRPLADVRTVRTLRRQLVGYDVVHAHGLRAAAFTGLALGRRAPGRTPFVTTWHNAMLGSGWRRRALTWLERIAAGRADLTLGASADLVERATTMGASKARLGPVAAPPLLAARRDRAAVREELAGGERPLIMAIGRLAPQKRYDVLLEAARQWRARTPVPVVAIAGDGPLLGTLQARAVSEALPVVFLGRRSDVPDLLGAADVAVLTSDWEARALVAQEALRAGVPLVATAVGGIPRLVGNAAVLVPPNDPSAVAREVSALLDDPNRRAALIRRGYEQAASWPDEDQVAQDLASLYRSLARTA
jgi:glycosyltransferase involved in cell wall biosynthesis